MRNVCVSPISFTVTLQMLGLINNTDVFTAMCVLYTLKMMDDDKRALLGEDVGNHGENDPFSLGMELLQTASQSSRHAARYVTVLQQIGRECADEEPIPGLEQRSSVQSSFRTVGQSKSSQESTEFQDSMAMPRFGLDESVPNFSLNFTDSDGLLFGSGLLENTSMDSEGSMSWLQAP